MNRTVGCERSRPANEGEPVALGWREAMERALYGERGFFVSRGGPAGHFRTSVHASPVFATALRRLIARVDEALGHPDPLDIVDVGAGRGELLTALGPAGRVRLTAVEMAPRPADLPSWIGWRATLPGPFTGVLIATEWLDNVPLDVVEVDPDGAARYVEVSPDGDETLGDPVTGEDADWLDHWWPLNHAPAGTRAEVGRTRDAAWAAAVSTVERGFALCVDYGHLASGRPPHGTLTGFRGGRQVPPVPDGSCDITAHVAMDSLGPGILLDQRKALRTLGVDGARPPLVLASADPASYVRALAAASAAAELTDAAGLGGHYWLLHPRHLPTLPAILQLCW
jgi:SAM-dependent MidA family methyltransferase